MSNSTLSRISYALNCVNRGKREIFIFSYLNLMLYIIFNFFDFFHTIAANNLNYIIDIKKTYANNEFKVIRLI